MGIKDLAGAVRAVNRREKGLPAVLAADCAIFLLLLVIYFWARARAPVWPHPFHFPSGLMTISMLMFAVAASFVTHVAVRGAARGGDPAMVPRMLALAVVGWLTFLLLLAMEWARLYLVEHVSLLSNPWQAPAFGVVYYGLTAWCAAHIVLGVIWLSMAAQNPGRFRLFGLTLYVDVINTQFAAIAFFVILSAADLSGF